jgi:predicted negative regulator of RcsB-dependent stress response
MLSVGLKPGTDSNIQKHWGRNVEAYETEKDQLEAFKQWWKENGSSVVTGLLLGLAVIFGTRAWFSYQDRQNEAASHLYVQFMNGLEGNNAEQLSQAGDALVSEYNRSPYAVLAALGMARQQIRQGELEAARAQLQWALEHSRFEPFRHSARLRLLRLLVAMEDFSAADTLLAQAPATTEYAPLYAEVRGDLALARGDRAAAREAYREALAQSQEDAPTRPLLQIKLDDVL